MVIFVLTRSITVNMNKNPKMCLVVHIVKKDPLDNVGKMSL